MARYKNLNTDKKCGKRIREHKPTERINYTRLKFEEEIIKKYGKQKIAEGETIEKYFNSFLPYNKTAVFWSKCSVKTENGKK